MMMGIMSSAILGPFANYFVPIMIGARRMAFPRIEALTFWLLMAAGGILTTTIFFGGFPTGWTGYAPLIDQANAGMDSYIVFFALVGISMCLLGLNLLATIITMRAPGLTWSRLPIFVWGVVSTAILDAARRSRCWSPCSGWRCSTAPRRRRSSYPAAAAARTCTRTSSGSSGTPRSTSSRCPASRSCSSCCRCSRASRSGATGSRSSGMLGVTLLSWLVWQHHLFVSGINSDSRPFYMFSTELISVPTGFTFLCGLMTLWRGRIRFTVPMLFCLAWFFNFLIGGLSGVFLSDVPSDVTTHGSFFSMAHFHYTIMGGLVFTFFAAIYYWVPKMTGLHAQRAAREDPLLGRCSSRSTRRSRRSSRSGSSDSRGAPSPTRNNLQFLNDWASVSAFVLGASMLVFLYNLVYSLLFARVPAGANPWESRSIEWQLPSPVPVHNFDESRCSPAIRTATATRRRGFRRSHLPEAVHE